MSRSGSSASAFWGRAAVLIPAALVLQACGGHALKDGSGLAVKLSASVPTSRLAYRGAWVTATVRLLGGSVGRTAFVSVEPPAWPDPAVSGSPLQIGAPRVMGAGHETGRFATGGAGSVAGASVCTLGGPSGDGGGIVLSLPARTTTTVAWPIRLIAAPWPHQRIGLKWAVRIGAAGSSSQAQRVLTVGPFRATGERGIAIRLRARSRGRRLPVHGLPAYGTVRQGRPVQISGVVQPPLAGRRILISDLNTRSRQAARIGSVTTDRAGRFALDWRPLRTGTYTIRAALTDPPTGYAPGKTCDLAVNILRP
jgi:hypothetical protein